jgi:hypothetical protein
MANYQIAFLTISGLLLSISYYKSASKCSKQNSGGSPNFLGLKA